MALRARIARTVESHGCSAVAPAALSRQLVLISKELSVLDSDGEDDAIPRAADTPDEAWGGLGVSAVWAP